MVSETFASSMSSIQEGTDAVIHHAECPDLQTITGEYFDGKQRSKANAQAYDETARRQLQYLSEKLTGLRATPV